MASYLPIVTLVALMTGPLAFANDPSPLQDFCVADLRSNVFVNGFECKNPKLVTPDDFFFSGFDKPGNTMNPLGSAVTRVTVLQLPGLNTLGISLVRIDFAPNGGLNPPHTHPRASEIIVVIEGILEVAFVTSNPDNRLFVKTLHKGDVFVFPQGMPHFEINREGTPAVAISGQSSQNPGVIPSFDAMFRSNPPISDDVLEKAFMLDKRTVDRLQG